MSEEGRMMRFAWVAAVLALALVGLVPGEKATSLPSAGGKAATPDLLVGTGSCSGRSCHGGDDGEKGPAARSEYTRWVSFDPHARAHDTLLGEQSLAIMKHLGKAAQKERCLACHSPPQTATRPELAWMREGGTGCEACHGAAKDWLDSHTGKAWQDKKPEEKAAKGFAPLGSPVGLATACAGCHVGLPGRDVTHDLIAAGHPPLRFDLPTYLANLPQHWVKKEARPVSREADLWLADQVVSGRHAAALIADHAKGGPEFADQACYSCHRPLGGNGRSGRRGKPVLGAWYLGLMGPLSGQLPAGAGVKGALTELKAAWAEGRPADAAGKLAAELAKVEKGLGALNKAGRGRLRKALLGLSDEEMRRWERVAQAYYGLDALNRAEGAKEGLKGLAKRLAFPPGGAGPDRTFSEHGLRELMLRAGRAP
jgi:hypothetical protein